MRIGPLALAAIAFLSGEGAAPPPAAVYEFRAAETLTPVELNRGDTLRFTLRSGDVRTMTLEETGFEILERPKGLPGGVYAFSCRVRIDGHPLTMLRYVGAQESFYEPYVVNGMRIWFDTILDTFRKVPMRYPYTGNLRRRPHKDARFAVQDATLPVCPQEMQPWYPNERGWIRIGDCYNGDDCWLGLYLGQSCHGGLDINHPRGEPLRAPIDFDDHWLFDSLAAGKDNNRWIGLRRWPDGSVWALQTHHLIRMKVPEHSPLKAGTPYADAAGVAVGSHTHTHYEFKVGRLVDGRPPDFREGKELETKIHEETADPRPQQPAVFHLDPWILFRQIFEADRDRRGAIRAAMGPLRPAKAGEAVTFSSEGSRKGKDGGPPEFHWAFGDGGGARGARPSHVFARPGIYPVTLVVDDGRDRASFTQHVTVDGAPAAKPSLALEAPDELSFRPRPPHAMDAYGQPVRSLPFTLEFVARASRPVPRPRTVRVADAGGGALPAAPVWRVEGARWLTVEGRDREARVSVDAAGLEPGRHAAKVSVDVPGALNSPREFGVVLEVRTSAPASTVTVDDDDEGFSCTPYFWVGHRLFKSKTHYRTSGKRAAPGEFARYTPDLAAGTWEVAFVPKTPFLPGTRFDVRVRHRSGEEVVRVEPERSRLIGRFEFGEGTDGFVEIRAERSEGLVMADAVTFERVEPGRR